MSDKREINAGIQILAAVSEAIRDLGSVPSGHLYAQLMGHLSLDDYNKVIALLVKANLVKDNSHLLEWIGPKVGEL